VGARPVLSYNMKYFKIQVYKLGIQ
jgi:hypothetical protein